MTAVWPRFCGGLAVVDSLFNVDWQRIFVPEMPLLEIFLRGTIVYLALFFLLRLILRRESGTLGMTDLLVIVLLADAAQNAMADDYHSITDGLLLVTTIIGWDYVLNWLGYHFPFIQKFVHPPPLLLVENGRMLRRNMRRELLTETELMSFLREQGVEDLAEVEKAYMETDGRISVITRQRESRGVPDKRRI